MADAVSETSLAEPFGVAVPDTGVSLAEAESITDAEAVAAEALGSPEVIQSSLVDDALLLSDSVMEAEGDTVPVLEASEEYDALRLSVPDDEAELEV